MAKNDGKIEITSINQSGGITAHTVNIGAVPRRLHDAAKVQLLGYLRTAKPIHIIVGMADPDGLLLAEETRLFLESQGRPVSKVKQQMPGPSRRGQDVDDYPDRYEIVIGSR